MNYKMIVNIIGKIMVIMALLMLLPLTVSLIYFEPSSASNPTPIDGVRNIIAFAVPIVVLFVTGIILNKSFNKNNIGKIGVKEGIIIVSLTWILMSLFGAVPFMISGALPNFFDAFFEMSSGFTTTGASVILDVEGLSHGIQFWRSFSHWVGGMGILVFILAIIPESKEGSSMHILRAESPGPQVGKLVSKMKVTTRILYLIYFVFTIIEILFLWLGPDEKMTFFNSVIYGMGTAGTGGFSIDATGLAEYTAYSQYVIAIFMLLFGINFSIYYLLLIGNVKEIFKNEELKAYLIIVVVAVLCITFNILGKIEQCQTFEQSFRQALFQVASIITTTGYASNDFNYWPVFSHIVLICLMIFGGCAGSTAGGVKISRIVILFKTFFRKVRQTISPRKVEVIRVDGKVVDDNVVEGVQSFIVAYAIILFLCAFLISIDNLTDASMATYFTASLACISNVGPGLEVVGPFGSFAYFSNFSKLILSLEMIAGRLEIFPILVLFSRKTWSNR